MGPEPDPASLFSKETEEPKCIKQNQMSMGTESDWGHRKGYNEASRFCVNTLGRVTDKSRVNTLVGSAKNLWRKVQVAPCVTD